MDSQGEINFHVGQKFSDWANSFAGCDGGNIRGRIWFCGIEFGGKEDFNLEKVNEPIHYSEDQLNEWFKVQYDQKTLKLYASILGEGIDEDKYKEVAIQRKAFDKDSDVFKMNLYPLAFKDTSDDLWNKDFYNATGIPTKEIYRAYCQIYRFKTINSWVIKNKDTLKLIICTGLSYTKDFIMAFEGMEGVHREPKEKMVMDKSMKYKVINGDRTLLVIIPFLGWRKYDLYSNELIKEFGKEINNLCQDKIGLDFHRT